MPLHRKQCNVGDWVEYDGEIGRIKVLGANRAAVVFKCNDDWNRYMDYTAAIVAYNHLKLYTGPIPKSENIYHYTITLSDNDLPYKVVPTNTVHGTAFTFQGKEEALQYVDFANRNHELYMAQELGALHLLSAIRLRIDDLVHTTDDLYTAQRLKLVSRLIQAYEDNPNPSYQNRCWKLVLKILLTLKL